MRYYNILDVGAMVVTADLKINTVLDVKANCSEMLYIGNEIKNVVTITTTTQTSTNDLLGQENGLPAGTSTNSTNNTISSTTTITKPSLISIASDIYNQKGTFFPKYESKHISKDYQGASSTSNGLVIIAIDGTNAVAGATYNGGWNPYDAIPEKKNVKRIEFLSKIGHMYTHMYKYSESNTSLVVNEASIAGIEQILRNYHRDGYKLSPGILTYLTSHVCDLQGPLDAVSGDPALKNVQPICWDVGNVEPLIKRIVYKLKDRRSSDEARSRGKLLVTMQKRRRGVEPEEGDKRRKVLTPATSNNAAEYDSSGDDNDERQ
jgi:hypothetical protein